MGCCLSSNRRNSGDTSPYGQGHSNDASRAGGTQPTDSRVPIAHTTPGGSGRNQHTQVSTSSLANPPGSAGNSTAQPAATTPQSTNTHSSSGVSPALGHLSSAFRRFSSAPGANAGANAASDAPPNKPLQPAPPMQVVDPPTIGASALHAAGGGAATALTPASTAGGVHAARAEFFDTRVSGRPEMWAAVRLVCELVGRGELGDAQAVLDAAGGTCPSGMLWGRRGGCYDERGERYVVPVWCVGWPFGVPREDGEGQEGDSEMEERGAKWKEGKGKERAVDDAAIKGREIRVRARLSHTARDVMVRSGEEDSVSMLVQRLRGSGEVPVHCRLRIGYLGRLLQEDDSLTDQGWHEGHVINVFVFE